MKRPFYESILMAGSGGQGIMFIGKLLAYAVMRGGLNVTWLPSYGPAMRGGTANCTLVISDEPIGSPVVTTFQTLIVMNQPSFDAFRSGVKKGGLIILNSSLINREMIEKDVMMIRVPANEIAAEVGDERAANMVMLGAYVGYKKVVDEEKILDGLRALFGGKKDYLFEVNRKAFEKGMEFIGPK